MACKLTRLQGWVQAACPSLWLTADQPCHADWLSGCWRRHYLSWSCGSSLAAAFSCSETAVFAYWTAGVVTPTLGGQLIHWLPHRVWVMVAWRCRLDWAADRDELNPWGGARAAMIRKMTMTLLQICAVITEKGWRHPFAARDSIPQGMKSPHPSGFALATGYEVT